MDARPLLVVAAIGLAAWMQGPAGEWNAVRRRHDFRYTPDPKVIRVVAGAHRSTTADMLWLRTLPDMSREFADVRAKARWIQGSLEAITDLEPSFLTVYDFGQAYLSVIDRTAKGSIDLAIRLLEKGIEKNPRESGLYVRLAMLHYLEKKDREKTVEYLRKARDLPGFDSLSASMLSALLTERREDIVAIGYWADLMETGSPDVKRVAELNLWRTKAEIARRAAREFAKARGRRPETPDDLCTPEFVQAEVLPLVREGLAVRDGAPVYDRAIELDLLEAARNAERWCRTFRDQAGRWPETEDFQRADVRLPTPPQGKRWKVEDGRIVLVPADGT